jgi:hypothetical protein
LIESFTNLNIAASHMARSARGTPQLSARIAADDRRRCDPYGHVIQDISAHSSQEQVMLHRNG